MKRFLLIVLALSGIAFAQRPFIYLSTPRIYQPGEETVVELEFGGVQQVHLRLYKVEKPMEFFAEQRNIRSPKPKVERKPANFFHMLEGVAERSRRNTRYLAREIIGQRARIAIRDFLLLPNMEEKLPSPERLGPFSIPFLEGYPLLRQWTVDAPEDTTNNDDYYGYYGYEYEEMDLELAEPGVYLVEAFYGNYVAYAPVIVTEMSVVLKQDPEEVYVFAVNTSDGAPRARAKVLVLSDTLRMGAGRTDAKGAFATSFDSTRMRVLVEDGENFALLDKYYYSYDYFYDYETDSYVYHRDLGNRKIYLHTERPIYRPGQRVYFKGTVRFKNRGIYKTPAKQRVAVAIHDNKGNELYTDTLETDDFGGFADSMMLPDDPSLGRYTLSAVLDSSRHSVQFRVEEYRKPEFTVDVETDNTAYVQGEAVKITVSADYFFGAPVVEGEVKLKVYRRQYNRYWYSYSDYVTVLSGTTDSEGKTVFTYNTPKDDKSYLYKFEAEVRDPSDRKQEAETNAFVASCGVLVTVRPARYVVEPGEEAEISITTEDIFRKPTRGKVQIEVYRRHWDKEKKEYVKTVVSRKTIPVGSLGKATFTYVPKETGYYYVEARVSDDAGNESFHSRGFYVSQRGGYYYWGEADDVTIIFDKESYEVGEYAEALVIMPYENANFIASLESDRLYDVDVVKMDGNSSLLRFKVKREFVPNAYLSVCGVYDGDFFSARQEMKVTRREEILTIELKPDKDTYLPGERGYIDVTVKDSKGRPVKADLSIGVVDEAIYALASEIAPAIQDYFYAPRRNEVSTKSSVYFSFWGYERNYYRLFSARADSVVLAAYKGAEKPKIREIFKDMAYWNAFVRTDGQGKARVQITYPDNLTTWRVTARGITLDTKVGEARKKVLVTKDLLVRIVPPRFVTQRDSLVIPTIVHNYTRNTQEVELSFDVSGAQLLDSQAKTASIKPGGSFRADWPVRCAVPGDVVLTATALSAGDSDAMRLTIPCNPHGIERIIALSGFLPGSEENVTKNFTLPDETQIAHVTGKLTLTPTLGSGLFAGMRYLASYPYGCTEQTMSGFFPDLLIADLIRDPERGDSLLAAELPKMIEKGLAKLYGYQHSDGGWGWWRDDESMNFMTAYVMHGLLYARELDCEINPNVIDRGAQALKKFLKNRTITSTTERAYMTYVLAMAPGDHDQFVAGQLAKLEKEKPDAYSRALMSLAYLEMGETSKAENSLGKLKKLAQTEHGGDMVYYSGRVRAVEYWTDDAVEVTATALRAFVAIAPNDTDVPKMVYWLLAKRRGNRWKSTKDTALALLALAEYLGTTSDQTPRMEVTFTLNDSRLGSYSITQKELMEFNEPLEFDLGNVRYGSNALKVRKSGPGNFFYSMVVTFYSTEEGIPEGGDEMRIHRRYYRLVPKVEDNRIIYDKVDLRGPVKVAEPVLVELRTDCERTFQYVMIKDPIPAGFEIVKDFKNYRIRDVSRWSGYYNWRYSYSGREMHDDHMAFFYSWLYEGKYIYYIIEPLVPGRYHTMPAEISLMYYPDRRGHSDEALITVLEKN